MATRGVRHKHVRLNQRKLDRARAILEAATETEAIEKALDMVLAEGEILKMLRRIKGKARIERVFG